MDNQSSITRLRNIPDFKEAIDALITGQELSEAQKEILLSAAILLIKDYEQNPSNWQSVDFAYWIVLSYSLLTHDYSPLYDFGIALGLYPICSAITLSSDRPLGLLSDFSAESIRQSFSSDGKTKTIEQVNRAEQFSLANEGDLAYLAPTSFGKSELILTSVLSGPPGQRICIVVPTKSLLNQTAKSVRKHHPKAKILTHDEMYKQESSFIAIMTQERALRLLEANSNLMLDALFIDEAHHLFDSDSRAILLSRLIRTARQRSSAMRVFYMSPVLADVTHITPIAGITPEEIRVTFNMKEPQYYILRRDGSYDGYNRFFNEYLNIKSYSNTWACVRNEASEKNLVYVNSPRKIQMAAKELAASLPLIPVDNEISELLSMLQNHVHAEYDEIECIRHGVLYLHGQMPDSIKDYLEHKFATIESIRFAVANTVVLEGVNLPIDSIFILSSSHLHKRNLVNLIGRAGRLNRIFRPIPHLSKLRPKIVFIDNDKYDRKKGNMEHTLARLRSSLFSDEVKNPLIKRDKHEKLTEADKQTIAIEDYLENQRSAQTKAFMAELLEYGLNDVYNMSAALADELSDRIKNAPSGQVDTIELIYTIFINGLEDQIKLKEFRRLTNLEARNYYRVFLEQRSKYPLSLRISKTLAYFRSKAESPNPLMYIGKSFGDCNEDGSNDFRVYVDLSEKSAAEMVGLAIAKIQNEENLLRYDIARFVELLRRHNRISESDYNYFTYGTTNSDKIELCQAGLPLPLINRIEQANCLQAISKDEYGNLCTGPQLEEYASTEDDLVRFEIDKYLA